MPLKAFSHKADFDFWENNWKVVLGNKSLPDYYLDFEKNLRIKKIFFEKYLSRKEKIIEGGCGLGVWVYLLGKMGYDIEGVDFAEETINFIKTNFPALPVKKGNILALEYPNSYFGAYISLGVLEHFEKGPLPALKEANRVLKEKGVIILSIPYFNFLRRTKNFFLPRKEKGEFYQYFYKSEEINHYLKQAGFRIIRSYPYNPAKCLRDEFLRKRERPGKVGRAVFKNEEKISFFLIRTVINSFIPRRIFAHSLMVVAEKNKYV